MTPLSLFLVLFGLALHALPPRGLQQLAQRVRHWPAPLVGALVAIGLLLIGAMQPEGVAPFIYYQF